MTVMAIHIALLRAINVAGRNTVSMSALRDMLADLGFTGAQSLLQSGNLVFEAAGPPPTDLERMLEAETEARLGLRVDYIVRRASEWPDIIAANPFPGEAARDPGHLVVMFMKEAPDPQDVETLCTAITGPETVQVAGRQLYIVYPDGIGRSKLTGAVIERQVKGRGTARNWNTVLRLGRLAGR